MARYEIDHEGKIVEAETELCKDREKMLDQLFTQFGWSYETVEKQSGCYTLQLKDPNDNTRVINVYTANLRNESRSPYEKKGQTNLLDDPSKRDKDNTIILGIYVYKENDPAKDAIFVGFPVANRGVNSSMRGAHVNKLLVDAKTKGFVYDKELKIVGFRSEFIFYYLDNYKELHYGSGKPTESQPKKLQLGKLSRGENIILYGVPGCGKSYHIENEVLSTLKVKDENKIRTTFYQDYSNTDFVGQILPKVSGEKVEYIFNPGPFTLALIQAYKNPEENVALIVEEINRGNAPAIFGDIFQLLDRKNGVSEYGIKNVQVVDYLNDCNFGKDGEDLYYHFDEIKIPGNLYIYATMNTSDQNVYTLDTAFTRRWDKVKIPNNFVKKDDKDYFKKCYVPGTNVLWKTFADAINNHITNNLDNLQVNEDKQLGAFFIKDSALSVEAEVGKRTNEDNDMLKSNFAHKVLDYLWSDVSKFDHSIIFKPTTKDNNAINTLDALIDEFKKNGKSIFQDSILKKMSDNNVVTEESNVIENTDESVGIDG